MSAPKTESNGKQGEPNPVSPKGSKARRTLVVAAWAGVFVLALLGGAVWLLTPVVLDHGIRWALREFLLQAGYSLVEVKVEGGWGRPIVLRDLEVGPAPRFQESSATDLSIDRIEVAPVHLWELLFSRQRFLSRVSLEGVEGTVDLRAEVQPPLDWDQAQASLAEWPGPDLLPFLPRRIDFSTETLKLIFDDGTLRIEPCRVQLAEGHTRAWRTGALEFTNQSLALNLPPTSGATAWKDGVIYLANLQVQPGLTLRAVRFNLVRPGGPAVDLEAEAWGGWLRGDVSLGAPGEPFLLAVTFWAGQLQVPELLRTARREEEISGLLQNLRFSFRGQIDRLLEADATLRVEAGEMAWEDRAWEELVLGLQLRQKRVTLSELLLRQKENRVRASGEVLWPEDGHWRQTSARLEANLEVREVSDLLTLLLPAPPEEGTTGGSLQAEVKIQTGGGQMHGEAKASAEALRWQGTALGGFSTQAKFDGKQVHLAEFAWQNAGDSLRCAGNVRLQSPHVYQGEIQAEIQDIQPYLALLWQPEWGALPGGGFTIFWQGDGTRESHSGGLEIHLIDLRQPAIPEGITGVLAGTYSPENFYFGRCELRHGPFLLTWRLSAGQGGLYLDQIHLQARTRSLLFGEVYLPWNPWPALLGETWTEGLLPEKNLYVDVRSSRLQLQDLAALFGQKLPVSGRAQLLSSVSGLLSSPIMTTRLEVENLRIEEDKNAPQLVEQGVLDLRAEDGLARVEGLFRVPQMDPVALQLEFPFGVALREEKVEWIDPRGPLSGSIQLPTTELRRWQALFPGARRLGGTLSGDIELGQTLDNPSINGRLALQNGRLEMDRHIPQLTDANLVVRFDGDSFRLENSGGKIGGGAFQLQGSGDFSNWQNPSIELRLEGQQLLIMRNRQLRLRTNADVRVAGSLQGGGAVTGGIHLTDGRIFQRLEITPLLQAAMAESGRAPLLLPGLTGFVPAPFDAWKLDLTVKNADPFLLVGNVASGSIEPELRILGTLGDPRPTGTLTLRDVRAFLPFSVVRIPEGRIYFLEESPRSPTLDIRGFSEVLEYEIMLLAQGPLEEQNIILRSDPPLAEDQILLLLTTGLTPGSGAGMGEAAAGQGSLLLLKTLAREFEPEGVDFDSIINRIHVGTSPPPFSGMRPTLMGEFRFTDQFSLFSRRDGFGYFSGGVTHTWRFR